MLINCNNTNVEGIVLYWCFELCCMFEAFKKSLAFWYWPDQTPLFKLLVTRNKQLKESALTYSLFSCSYLRKSWQRNKDRSETSTSPLNKWHRPLMKTLLPSRASKKPWKTSIRGLRMFLAAFRSDLYNLIYVITRRPTRFFYKKG